jgi:hypothetical protein
VNPGQGARVPWEGLLPRAPGVAPVPPESRAVSGGRRRGRKRRAAGHDSVQFPPWLPAGSAGGRAQGLCPPRSFMPWGALLTRQEASRERGSNVTEVRVFTVPTLT